MGKHSTTNGNSDNHYSVGFKDVWHFYPNLIGYFRYFLCIVATFTMFSDMHLCTGSCILLSFILDIFDGKIARAYNQCTILGDGLDWGADLYIDILLMVWWGTLQKEIFPFAILWTMVEVVAAIYDFAIVACDRYPPRPEQSGLCIIIQWAIPGGKYSLLGWIIWLSYPFFITARCFDISGTLSFLLPFWKVMQVVLVIPSALFIWCNLALLISGLNRWQEKRKVI